MFITSRAYIIPVFIHLQILNTRADLEIGNNTTPHSTAGHVITDRHSLVGYVIDFFVVVKSVVMLSTVIRRNLTSLDPLHSYFLNGNYTIYYTVYTGCSFV